MKELVDVMLRRDAGREFHCLGAASEKCLSARRVGDHTPFTGHSVGDHTPFTGHSVGDHIPFTGHSVGDHTPFTGHSVGDLMLPSLITVWVISCSLH